MKNPTGIATFYSAMAAKAVGRRLRDAGFEVAVRFGVTLRLGLDSREVGVHRVIVPLIEAARALSWCREFDAAEGMLEHAIRCPECGSLRVDLEERHDGNVRGTLFLCVACRSSWSVTPTVRPAQEHAAA